MLPSPSSTAGPGAKVLLGRRSPKLRPSLGTDPTLSARQGFVPRTGLRAGNEWKGGRHLTT